MGVFWSLIRAQGGFMGMLRLRGFGIVRVVLELFRKKPFRSWLSWLRRGKRGVSLMRLQ